MIRYNINIYQGQDFNFQTKITSQNGTPIDLENYNLSGTLHDRYGNNFLIKKTGQFPIPVNFSAPIEITKIDDKNGIINLFLSSGQTSLMPVDQGIYSIVAYNISGSGNFNVLEGFANIYKPSI